MTILKSLFTKKLQYISVFSFVIYTLPTSADADELDTLQFNSSITRTWDNNLFKRSSNESSEQITTYTAGMRLDKSYSLQRFLANVNYVDNKYQNNDFLDFDTVNYDAAWLWSLTPSLTGTLSRSRTRSLAGFADFRTFAQNIRTNETNQFRAEYSPHKVWKLIAGVTNSTASNSQTFNTIPNFDYDALDYGAGYNLPSGATVTFLGHKRSGSYNRPLNTTGLFDNGYSEDEYELDLIFKATGKSNLSAKVAYISREYDNFSERNYAAWNGFIRYDVLLSGKLKVNSELARTIGVFETNYSTYSQTDTLTVGLDYYFANKLTMKINGRLAQRDFKQPVFSGLPSRSDDESSFGGAIEWEPTSNVAFTLKSAKSKRAAHGAYNQFDYDDVTTSLAIDLKI